MRKLGLAVAVILAGFATQANAWWDMGHKQIAALAYSKLTPAAKSKVNQLIRRHLAYPMWIEGLEGMPVKEVDQAAFVNAAVWADDIKNTNANCLSLGPPGCYVGGPTDRVDGPRADANAGLADHLIHDHWHYYDIPFSPDGTQTVASPPVNALSQIKVFTAALADPAMSDDIKSFDLVWLLHLVGDAHQPLHTTQRFTSEIPDGDRGGNEEKVDIGVGALKLHQLWDGILGESGPAAAAVAAATALPPADPVAAALSDPAVWFDEGFTVAKAEVYTTEIGPGIGDFKLSAAYLVNARKVAEGRASIAGARLANLINAALK